MRRCARPWPPIPTAGADQQAMVRDLCQGGAGVAVVVGRAGTGKTFALGIARHAWQLDGYRLLAAAPTGIATVSLQGEGFEDVATCDRLLGDLDRGREQLDARTVLVVDEAGMLGSRKLARLLEHAQQAQAKVVLVGDDRQLAAIDAGGGFRALRLRLGASELTENRRQHQAWEREALELVRSGLVEEAVAAYQAHDRVVAADSKPAATLALLQDWWAAWQQAERDPAEEVVVLAARRTEVDRLNTACQELLAARGRLGPERLQVEDRQLAVGDRVVCGKNAIAELGVANGSRGHRHRPRPPGPDPDDPAGRHRRPGGHPARSVPGWPRPRRAQPPGGPGLCHHRPPRPRADPRAGPGPAHRHRGRQLAVCAAVPGPPGHPPVCGGRSRTPGRRGAGPARPGAARRLCAAGPGPVAGWRPAVGHRHPQQPGSPAALDTASCGPSEIGCAASSTRPPATAAGSWPGPPPTASRPRKPWPPTSSPPITRRPACLAGCATAATTRCRVGWRWPPSRPTGPRPERELRQHQQRRDGWLEANAHLGPSIGRSCGAGLAAPRHRLAVERPARLCPGGPGPVPRRPGGGGPGAAAAEIEQYRRTYQITDPSGPSAPSRTSQPSGPTASGPAPPSSGSRQAAIGRRTAPADQRAPNRRDPPAAWPARPGAGRRLAPPKEHPMASSHRPFDDDRPSGSMRPLSQADLQAILAHLGDDPDELLARTGADRPVVALRVRASVGRPGGSAHARWRRSRAAEWAAWTRTLPWRIAVTLGIGVGGGVLGRLLAPRLGLVVGVLAATGGRLGAAVPAQPGRLCLAAGSGGGAAHRPPARAAGAARLGGPARPGRPREPGQHRPPGDRPGRGVRDRLQAVSRPPPTRPVRAAMARPLPPRPHRCRRCRSRPTRPLWSCPTPTWW